MNIWIKIKGEGIQDNVILVLQDGCFYSKSNIIMKTITSSRSDIKELCCDILSGSTISDASIIETKTIPFVQKHSILSFFNKILYLFVKPEIRIDVAVVKRKDNSFCVSFTKAKDTFSFTHNYSTAENADRNKSTPNKSNGGKSKVPKLVFFENIEFFKELLEPLFSCPDKRDFYIKEWKHAMTLFPDGNCLQEEFEIFEKDIDLWFNTLFSWGVKRDKCKEYKAGSFNKDFYDVDLSDGGTEFSVFKVIIPSWSYIENNGSGNNEILIKKGLLRNECL